MTRDDKIKLLLIALFLVSCWSKSQVDFGRTSDRHYYIVRLTMISNGIWEPEFPLPFLFLVVLHVFLPVELAVRWGVILAASLPIFPGYYVMKRWSGWDVGSVITAAALVFNVYIYQMVQFVIYKNLVGNLFFVIALYELARPGLVLLEKPRPRAWILWGLVLLTHPLSIFLLGIFFVGHFVHATLMDRTRWRHSILYGVILGVTGILATWHFLGRPDTLLVYDFWQFNYPRFMENFTYVPVAASMFVAFSVLWSSYRREAFPFALAFTSLSLHLLSCVIKHGMGIRFIYLLPIPMAFLLSVKFRGQSSRQWVFLAFVLIAPYVGRYVMGNWP